MFVPGVMNHGSRVRIYRIILSTSSFVNNLKLPPLTKDDKPSLPMCFFALKKWINWSAVVRKSYDRVVFEERL
jgi:hypothetical protein